MIISITFCFYDTLADIQESGSPLAYLKAAHNQRQQQQKCRENQVVWDMGIFFVEDVYIFADEGRILCFVCHRSNLFKINGEWSY